ncbi:MAG: putative Ig domain-containing protein, partial [Pontibacter sp.]|nr:putative Ig domain-containing protein [Pontibacter sp.]
ILSYHISPSKLNPNPDEPIDVYLSFKNIGAAKTGPFAVRGAVNDVTLGETIEVANLNAGSESSVKLTARYCSPKVGAHIIRGFVDILNQVDEVNELNNEASRAIIVGESANLLFAGLALSSGCPGAGSMLTLTPTVRNEGDLSATGELRLSYVTASRDTVLIQTSRVSVSAKQSVVMPFEWTVAPNTVAIFAELVNTSPMEFNYFDNSTSQALCPPLTLQEITFEAIPDKTFGDSPFELNATASSGLDVTYDVISGPVSVTGSSVTILGAGTVTIRASQAGNEAFDPAIDAVRSFKVNKATPVISWTNPADIVEGTALSAAHLNATASFNGNSVPGTFAYTPPAGTILPTGDNQELSVDFTPNDTDNLNPVSGTKAYINVKAKPVVRIYHDSGFLTQVTSTVTMDELSLLTLYARAENTGGKTVTYSLQGTVPAGMGIDQSTGTVSWTPT